MRERTFSAQRARPPDRSRLPQGIRGGPDRPAAHHYDVIGVPRGGRSQAHDSRFHRQRHFSFAYSASSAKDPFGSPGSTSTVSRHRPGHRSHLGVALDSRRRRLPLCAVPVPAPRQPRELAVQPSAYCHRRTYPHECNQFASPCRSRSHRLDRRCTAGGLICPPDAERRPRLRTRPRQAQGKDREWRRSSPMPPGAPSSRRSARPPSESVGPTVKVWSTSTERESGVGTSPARPSRAFNWAARSTSEVVILQKDQRAKLDN